MLNSDVMAWGSLVTCVTTYVGYQAGSLKARVVADREYRDPETGMLTRKGFEHRALKMLAKSCNYIVVMVDLNDLKKVNDEFGHAAGDMFIREQAGRISDWARRKNGVAARLGGDEFVVIVTGSADTTALKEDLNRPICWEGETRYWTASVGFSWISIGVLKSDRKNCLSKALGKADQDMYKNKGEGRSRR
jgi:diguanylate cyclase (GGDEF)-like protein